jgi:hypothetical protein
MQSKNLYTTTIQLFVVKFVRPCPLQSDAHATQRNTINQKIGSKKNK